MARKYETDYGEGSFFKRGERWVGALEAGWTAEGKRRRVEVSSKSKELAWQKFVARRKELQLSGPLDPAVTLNTNIKTWVNQWLNMRIDQVRPKTYASEKSVLTKWVIPVLGSRRIVDIGPADVRRLTAAMRAGGSNSTHQAYGQRIFLQCMKAARLEGHDVQSRIFDVPKPRLEVSSRDAIPLGDSLRLLQEAAARSLPELIRWTLALVQGQRQMESLGIRWESIFLESEEAGLIVVDRQLQEMRYLDRDAGTFQIPPGYEAEQVYNSFHLVRPKSASGARKMPMIPQLASMLWQLREDTNPEPADFLFHRADSSAAPIRPEWDRANFRALQDAANVRKSNGDYFVVHECRHTAATLLMEANVDPDVAKIILGQSSVEAGERYRHVDVELERRAFGAVSKLADFPRSYKYRGAD